MKNRDSNTYPEQGLNRGYGSSDQNPYRYTAGTGGGEYSDYGPDLNHPYRNQANSGRSQDDRGNIKSRGYSDEDFPAYRERLKRSEYPDTYRSAMSGYISEYVGDDMGRRDYNSTGKGNLFGTTYGLHKGKGPRNYKRSDMRISEEINDRLTDDPYIDATQVEIHVQNGEVILTGIVDERREKRRAEEIAEEVSGVTHLENRLRVASVEKI